MKVIIIGAGISGLTAGIYARKNNLEVEILERNDAAGGLCTGWERKGSYIDGCLHWLTESDRGGLNEIWKETGALNENVPIYYGDAFFEATIGEKTVKFYLDLSRLEKELLSFAKSKADEKKVKTFIRGVAANKNSMVPTQKPFHLWGMGDGLKYMKSVLPVMKWMKKFGKISIKEFAESFESEALSFAFSHALVPGEFSMFSLLNTMGGLCAHNSGIPAGGSKAFVERMKDKFLSLGGKLNLKCEAKEIAIENGKATGVVTADGKFHSCDYVIASCDLHHTLDTLLKGNYPIHELNERDKAQKENPVYSIILISFRTDKDLSKLSRSKVFASREYEVLGKRFHSLAMEQFGYDPSLIKNSKTVVQAAINTDQEMYETLKAMTREEYVRFKQDLGAQMQKIIEEACGDVYGATEFLDVATPLTFERYVNSYKGSFMTYMLTKSNRQMMLMNNALPLDNVVLAGQWLMMPGGTPVAAVEGKFAADTIVHAIAEKE